MLSRCSRRPLFSLFGLLSPSASGLKVSTYPPARPLPFHTPMERPYAPWQVQVSTLPNGVRVLTESTDFPSAVTLAVCVGAGPRDEDVDHSGMTMALKNTFLKTNTRTNEQLNYCIIQMSGGDYSMSFDQESMLYTGQCLAHDTYDFLQLTSDVLLDDKTTMDEEAAHWRADEYFHLRDLNRTHETEVEDRWLTTAYGVNGLGMPLAGFQSKFQNVGYAHLNHFRGKFATPDRIIVMGAGINNHEEFVEAVKPYFLHLDAKKAPVRKLAQYLGGELKTQSEEQKTTIHMSFHGPPAGADAIFPLIILRTLVGESTAKCAPSACRASTHFIQKYPFITSARYSYAGFTDSSNLGITLSGLQGSKLADALTTELSDLTKVSEQEVHRAKLRFQGWIANNFESAKYRLYKYSMGMRFEGTPRTLPEIMQKSSAVTAEEVRSAAKSLLQSKPTLLVQGNTHSIPSVDTLHARLA